MVKKTSLSSKKAFKFLVRLLYLLSGRYKVSQLHKKASTCAAFALYEQMVFLKLTWWTEEATSVVSVL